MARSPHAELALRAAVGAAAALALYAGWSAFWFLCDDAYIAFRYASNAHAGFGYVWNPPPFRPVEGYTSFLWLALLDWVWRLFGVAPTDAANRLSLAFSYASLALVAALCLRLRLGAALAARRTALFALVLLGTVTNRTFLTWTSSGLETALFGCLVLAWVWLALCAPVTRAASCALALAAALLALTRPDGLLFAAATLGLLALRARDAGRVSARALEPALPLLLVVAHLVWRRATYGDWLPNTWYAKHVGAWPESGARYAAAFALEYAAWIWLALAALAGARVLRGDGRAWLARLRALEPGACAALLVVAALAAHFAYYTFAIGGDHFEFRIYQHLVPLLLVSLVPLAERAGLSARSALAALVAMIALSWPIPWLHWWHTHELATRRETYRLHYRVAPHFPAPLRAYAGAWDELQGWLIAHSVGVRHQEHVVFAELQRALFPPRAEGSRISADGHPVLAFPTVGVPGWSLPHVAILDLFGLNDAVIARSPPRAADSASRQMAHDRAPPAGYVECFRPNVFLDAQGRFGVRPRTRELTDAEISDCERRFRDSPR